MGETSFPYRKDHRSIAGVAALSLRCGETYTAYLALRPTSMSLARCGETYTAYLGRTENNSVEIVT